MKKLYNQIKIEIFTVDNSVAFNLNISFEEIYEVHETDNCGKDIWD